MTDTDENREPAPTGPGEATSGAEGRTASAEPEVTAADTARRGAKRKKKRKKRRQREEAPEPRPELDERGRERPAFLSAFPHDPDLDRLIAAYEAGNYARVRRDAPALAERSEDRTVRDAALELRRRIDPDPLARYLLLIAICLLVFLVIWVYVTHGR